MRRAYNPCRICAPATRSPARHSDGATSCSGDILHILPYHAELDTIVDLLIESVPMNGSYTILVWSDDELSLEPLRRLPPGIAIAHPRSERATTELRRRFPNLDPANN